MCKIIPFPEKTRQSFEIEDYLALFEPSYIYNKLTQDEQAAVCLAQMIIAFQFNDSMVNYDFRFVLHRIAYRHKLFREG